MAQKPNFLKRLISKRLIKTISTAAFIAATSSSAMGAGVQKTVNVPTASFGTGTDWLPAVAVGNGDSLLYSATGNTIIGNVNNTVTINNNGINPILQIGTATAGNTVGVAGVVGSKQLTIMMMNESL
ncbi:hypothetical protein [Rickettsia endosymbiont of Rhinocyllus conicus]|uniref:hypothetical protein n=1 Tax=Rickettsia endosymbiont of Rhinocyllus conicus TaxID=3066252 RepID=UPI003132A2BD